MHVASLELCKELHELSGWRDTELIYARNGYYEPTVAKAGHPELGHDWAFECPAYDLGFLLRKLPLQTRLTKGARGYSALYSNAYTRMPDETPVSAQGKADTPEDAVAKLCIALFKAGLLKQQEPK